MKRLHSEIKIIYILLKVSTYKKVDTFIMYGISHIFNEQTFHDIYICFVSEAHRLC